MSTTWKQVVLDVADAWREANDSTAKIPVGELPNKVKEGGENIDPELTTLEGTLQEILEILPFKGAMASGQYVWKKLTAEGGDFISFISSDDASAFPDGGTKDGYWYELVKEGLTAESFGFTKASCSSFTITNNITTLATLGKIHHSLDEVAKMVVIYSPDKITATDRLQYLICNTRWQMDKMTGTSACIGGEARPNLSSTSPTMYEIAVSDISENATDGISFSKSVYLAQGVEYFVLAMA